VASLGASVAMTNVAKGNTAYAVLTGPFHALTAKIMEPEGDPISPPTPLPNPKREGREAPALEPGVVAQCGPATIVSKLTRDKESLIYRTIFAPTMIDDMVKDGCAQFYQGCNICSVRYDGCSDEDKASCKTAACLEKTCKRRVRCSSKICQVQGKEPTCKARMARTSCRKRFF